MPHQRTLVTLGPRYDGDDDRPSEMKPGEPGVTRRTIWNEEALAREARSPQGRFGALRRDRAADIPVVGLAPADRDDGMRRGGRAGTVGTVRRRPAPRPGSRAREPRRRHD
ncbi:hypothetical protein Adi01nite_66340 [Amorphoplanes digitatis]|nr:hypothetical protein Adi01nite_66340 [Actinoplanes digitatis]